MAACVLLGGSTSRTVCEAFTSSQANAGGARTRQLHVLQEPNLETNGKTMAASSRKRRSTGSAKNNNNNMEGIPDQLPSLSEVYSASKPSVPKANDKTPKRKPNMRAAQKRQRPSNSPTGNNSNSQQSTNNKNNKSDNSSTIMHTRGPWLASFHTSRQTQQRIQQAGRQNTQWSPSRRATYVLKTLLEQTPVEHANAANLVCALCLSAKLRGSFSSSKDANQLRQYLWQAVAVLRELNRKHQLSARQICNAAWALAKHADRDPTFLPAPAVTLSAESHFGTAEEWSLDFSAAQVVDAAIDELATELADRLQHDPWVAKEGELCMACWAYGVLRARQRPAGWKWAPKVGNAVGVQLPQSSNSDALRFEQWQGSSLSSSGAVTDECSDLDPPGPTDLLLNRIAFSLCQYVVPNTTDAPLRLQTCRWSELSHIAWAHASHGWSCSGASEGLLLAVATEAAQRLKKPGKHLEPPLSRDMAQLVWSFGVLQTDNFRLTAGLLELLDGVTAFTQFPSPSIVRPFAAWSCPDIVQVPLALAHARIDNQDLLRELYSEAKDRIESSSSRNARSLHAWEISILLWAQARLHLTSEQGTIFEDFAADAIDFLLAAAKKEGGWNSIGIGAQEQANLIWSLTVLEKFRSSKSIRLLQELFLASQEECRKTGMIQLEHAHQLWQALFLLEEEAPRSIEGTETWFRDTLEAKWLQEKARPKVSSARHQSLSKTLTDMGVAHFNEHDEDIDVAIVLKRAASWTHETDRMSLDGAMRVAVEFDGPNHFTRILDTSSRQAPRPLGHSVLKYRLLKRQGWTVVRVPYYEFDRIPFWASMERQRYVQRLLKTHSDLRFSSVDISEYKPPVANRQSRFQ